MDALMTIKQYAAHAGVSVQSVYRRLQTPQNAAMLEGHIIRERGSTYLDAYAVQFLDGTRPAIIAGSPAAQQEQMVRELSDRAHKLQEENDVLKEKLMDALQRLTDATKAEAEHKVALADAQSRVRLLEAQNEATGDLLQEHKEQARQKAEEAARLREDLDQARNEVHQLRLDTVEMDQLRNDLREAENEAEGFRAKYQGAGEEISQLRTRLQETENEAADLREKYQDAGEEIQQLQADLEEADTQGQRYQSAAEAADIAREAARAEAARYREECFQNADTSDKLNEELRRLRNRGLLDRIFNR